MIIVARKDGEIVRVWSRNRIYGANQFPMIVEAIRRLPVDRIVLDGRA
jgi:ATP-dependent DNA ligase